ncbi:hypothetical protein [Streptomyces lydicus]|uniref:hypothetical protein n=1 Tax=Streptomyces lydicus TaxID=47763 RepID=UPI0036EAE5D6
MTINHREKAEELLEVAAKEHILPNGDPTRALAAAQVHATLARDEEQAATTADTREALHSLRRRFNDTRALVARHIADGLASREKDRWKAALDLSKALDEAHCNVDDLVDARLTDDGWDPRSAYKTPAGSGGWIGYASKKAPERDPWAARHATEPSPYIPGRPYSPPVETALRNLNRAGHVTPADTLAAAIRVIAGHIAEALTDGDNEHVRNWARSIADELNRVGLDLRGAIESRVEDLNGGIPFSYDPAPLGYSDEPPF